MRKYRSMSTISQKNTQSHVTNITIKIDVEKPHKKKENWNSIKPIAATGPCLYSLFVIEFLDVLGGYKINPAINNRGANKRLGFTK